ncbi:hypothetical protein Leryth_005688 [Lithospermum erythrorhizon]|uniref:BURP domain-containing protein n=1 Tax=Lithospermum erythrorhizon TaxID=34254 RepID=A0AAV3RHE2_LITER|nr:hypothetical protein Leryth_005688 [Lithospermum erythrorhizon]
MKMDSKIKIHSSLLFYFLFLSALLEVNITLAAKENPLTAKASLTRYWNKQITNSNPNNFPFILSKASPLSTIDSAFYTKLITQKALSSHLTSFCSSAKILCFLDSQPTINTPTKDANFKSYNNKGFANYGGRRRGGIDTFKSYSDGANFANGQFTTYSKGAINHQEGFSSYAQDGNVGSANFSSYAATTSGGSGDFKSYLPRVNVPNLRFASYDSSSNKHKLSFTSYVEDTNSGNQAFISYAKNGKSAPLEFNNYGTTSNVMGSSFTGYNELGTMANDSFKMYSSNANNPGNGFNSYGTGVKKGGIDTFTSYRDDANAGKDTFQFYGKNSNGEKADFVNYGNSFNEGLDTFKGYGQGSINQRSNFKIYGVKNSFKEYDKKGHASFSLYTKPANKPGSSKVGKSKKMWGVEEGKFFREFMLREGTTMKMPDIQDKMPKRSFLPRSISSKLPFSSGDLNEMKRLFNTGDNSTLERLMMNTLVECERPPSIGETKKCVASAEDIIDFAVTVLGHNVVVRTTVNVKGSKRNVMIGKVTRINGGKVTTSVSCHQSLYPYLVYYCHSVPKVRVYETDILEVESKAKINHAVAICHVDTSSWSPGHGAFVALGSGPGLIEVCHWIFENDMTWNTADY